MPSVTPRAISYISVLSDSEISRLPSCMSSDLMPYNLVISSSREPPLLWLRPSMAAALGHEVLLGVPLHSRPRQAL